MRFFSHKPLPRPAAPSGGIDPDEAALAHQRDIMVSSQIEARGVADPRVLEAMRAVPRHKFIRPADLPNAHDDGPLPIGLGQTISQPYIVALMTELLNPGPDDTILEIGTGCGYQAAVLARLARRIITIERHAELAASARELLNRLGIGNVTVIHGDGYDGWPALAPYDGIIVTAAPPEFPAALLSQLKPGGLIVIPVGVDPQDLQVITHKPGGGHHARSVTPVRFVPLLRD